MTLILACTDGSTCAESVHRHAAWAAGRLGAGVEVLHVIDHHREHAATSDLTGTIGMDAGEVLTEELARLEEAAGREARLRGREFLEEARRQLSEMGVGAVTLTQRHGPVVETIAGIEGRAELVVIGKSGEHAVLAEGQVGGHLENLVRVSSRPVLVAGPEFRPIRRFLLAFDDSPSARRALDHVARSPLLRGLECRILMVGRTDASHRAALEAARVRLEEAGLQVTAENRPGRPAPVLGGAVVSGGVDLVVMGAYGHSQVREFFVGSTTTRIVRTCPVSVLMFH